MGPKVSLSSSQELQLEPILANWTRSIL